MIGYHAVRLTTGGIVLYLWGKPLSAWGPIEHEFIKGWIARGDK